MKKLTNEELQNIKTAAKTMYKKGASDGSVRLNKPWYDIVVRLCEQAKTANNGK